MQTVEEALRHAYVVRDELQSIVDESRPGWSSHDMDLEARYLRAAHALPSAKARVALLEELVGELTPVTSADATKYPDHRIADYKTFAITVSVTRGSSGFEPLVTVDRRAPPPARTHSLVGDGLTYDSRDAALAAGVARAQNAIDAWHVRTQGTTAARE